MKRFLSFFLTLFLSLISLGLVQAKETKTFALIRPTYNGPEQYQYLSRGIQSMLQSRVTKPEQLVPGEQGTSELISANIKNPQEASRLVSDLQVDLLLWGSVTIMQEQASIDYNILEKDSSPVSVNSQGTLDSLIPALEDLAAKVHAQVLGLKPSKVQAKKQAEKPKKVSQKKSAFEYVEKDKTLSEARAIEYSSDPDKSGLWKSQSLSYRGSGMVIGDANADGKQEIFILNKHLLQAYIIKNRRLQPIGKHEFSPNLKCLNINLIDMNKDGLQEILISAVRKQDLCSKILNFENNKFSVKEDNLDYYLNVLRTPPGFIRTIVAQRRSPGRLFKGGVHELMKVSGKYKLGRRLPVPDKANVLNCAFLPYKESYRVVLADKNDHLRVYSSANKRLYTSDAQYCATPLKMDQKSTLPGMDDDPYKLRTPQKYYYVPIRLIPINLHPKKKGFELLAVANISKAAEFFDRYRTFPQSSIHSLYWDGIGLNLFWKTKQIKGTVRDIGVADADNDGTKELCVCVNTHPGTFGIENIKTYVLRYELDLDKENDFYLKKLE